MSVTIIGFGLIGGSIGKALVKEGWRIRYLDPHVPLTRAVTANAAHDRIEDIEAIPPGDLVVYATPVDVTRRLLAKYRLSNDITTVCSVMGPFSDLARVTDSRLVAGHPLAGAETSGFDASKADLFAGRRWFVDQEHVTDRVSQLIAACGSEERPVDPEEHDRALAYTSHLPQLLSTALASVIAESGIDVETFGGAGLKTFLRLAASDRAVWRPIFESNADALELGATDTIETIERILTGDDVAAFEAAQRVAARLAGGG